MRQTDANLGAARCTRIPRVPYLPSLSESAASSADRNPEQSFETRSRSFAFSSATLITFACPPPPPVALRVWSRRLPAT
jgi:hypothetical protein